MSQNRTNYLDKSIRGFRSWCDRPVNMNAKFIAVLLLMFWIPQTNHVFANKEEPVLAPVTDGKIIYQEVVDLSDEYKTSEIYEAVERWAQTATLHRKVGGEFSTAASIIGGVNVSPVMGSIEANHRSRETFVGKNDVDYVSLKFYQHYQSKGVTNYVRTLFIDSDLEIQIKDGKYRYTLSDFEWEHWNHFTGTQMEIYGKKDGCSVRGSLYDLQSVCDKVTKSRIKALIAINDDVQKFIIDMKAGILEQLKNKATSNDW